MSDDGVGRGHSRREQQDERRFEDAEPPRDLAHETGHLGKKVGKGFLSY